MLVCFAEDDGRVKDGRLASTDAGGMIPRPKTQLESQSYTDG